MLDDQGAVWPLVAKVADAMEAELDALVTSIEDRAVARMQATTGEPSAALQEAIRRGVSAAGRDALARLRSRAELPQELLPDLIELARLSAGSDCDLAGLDAWLEGQDMFWDRFQAMAERTLEDTAICWYVIKAARGRLSGHAARLSGLFRTVYERESGRVTGIDEDSRLRAVLRALDGQWVDPSELGYDLAGHHIAMVADASSLVDAVARRINRQLLRVQAPDGWIWGWLGGQTRISEDDLDSLIASHGSSEARIAFGEPAAGIAGFAVSHQQALEARAAAVATNQHAVRFADLRLLIAILRDGDLAKGFIERELGELDRPSERMRELRETLRAYLEHSQSVSAAAARLRSRRPRSTQPRTPCSTPGHR